MISDKTFVEKDLGPETKLTLEYKDGDICLKVIHAGKIGGAGAEIFVDGAMLIDAITDLIPGEWDDKILDGLAEKVLSKKTS